MSQPIANAAKLVEYAKLVERDGEVCQWCGRGPSPEYPLTIDHVDPEGGEGLDNKQLLCAPCNSSKGDSTDDKAVRWQSGLFQHGFTIVPNVVLTSEVLDVYAMTVYTLLLYYARQDDSCWPGQEGLAKKAKCSDRQVREAIRALEAVGLVRTRRRGRGMTNVYILLAPRAARGSGLNTSRPESRSALDRNEVPTKKKQLKKTQVPTTPAKGEQIGFGGMTAETVPDKLVKTVAKKRVTDEEYAMAEAVLATYNAVFQPTRAFAGKAWLQDIIGRIREHPELSLADHRAVMEKMHRNPWWKDSPTPGVVYGNGKVFDRSLNAQDKPQDATDWAAYDSA